MDKQVVIVTGAGNGIGKEVAKAYAKNKMTVVAADIDFESVQMLKSEVEKEQGGKIYPVRCDVKSEEQIVEMIRHVDYQFDRIDVLINNAGVSRFCSPYELSVNEWDEIMNTNVRSVFICTKEAAKIMKKNGGGAVVNISSTRARMSEPHSEAYAASKGGILSLTHAFAASLQEDGIVVNAISPGWIHTGSREDLREVDHQQHFSKRVGKPDDIARACLFLTNPENSFITGENVTIDGGMTRKMIYES
ncbi:SDR family NAD(P)-dependent oxidoreductase [Bacillus sp. FJAT-45037]|uniref:SDR family NAD(P)-dependent oxidoreductase n=1 Tax=Bacillus sp. FJAT-45037 TaxID=2011007 RepID=UPI000C231465|nr:SDR family oxidoreductase [Bacillus sp. FJAT-45037]